MDFTLLLAVTSTALVPLGSVLTFHLGKKIGYIKGATYVLQEWTKVENGGYENGDS